MASLRPLLRWHGFSGGAEPEAIATWLREAHPQAAVAVLLALMQHCPRMRVPPGARPPRLPLPGAPNAAAEEAAANLLAAEWGVAMGRLLCYTVAAFGLLGGTGVAGAGCAAGGRAGVEPAAGTEETVAAALMCAAALRAVVADDDALAALHITPCSVLAVRCPAEISLMRCLSLRKV